MRLPNIAFCALLFCLPYAAQAASLVASGTASPVAVGEPGGGVTKTGTAHPQEHSGVAGAVAVPQRAGHAAQAVENTPRAKPSYAPPTRTGANRDFVPTGTAPSMVYVPDNSVIQDTAPIVGPGLDEGVPSLDSGPPAGGLIRQ